MLSAGHGAWQGEHFSNVCKGVEYIVPPVNYTFLCGRRIVVSSVVLGKGSLCSKASSYEQSSTWWKLSFTPAISVLSLMTYLTVHTHLLPGLSSSSNHNSVARHPDTHYLLIICGELKLDTARDHG